MKTQSPFRKGYKSSWYSPPSLAALCKPYKLNPGFREVEQQCGCETCRKLAVHLQASDSVPPSDSEIPSYREVSEETAYGSTVTLSQPVRVF